MLHIILTAIDAIIGIFILTHSILPVQILITSSTYLIAKGAFFTAQKDIISMGDILAGIYIILLILNKGSIIISVILAAFLIQKAFWCFR